MGVVDAGLTPTNGKYSYTAETFRSTVSVTKLNIGASSLKGVKGQMTIQLNAISYDMYSSGSPNTFWTQDVVSVKQEAGGKYAIQGVDNIWNFNAGGGSVPSSIAGNLNNDCASGMFGIGSPGGQWFCFSKQVFVTTLPFTITLEMGVGVLTSGPHAGSSGVIFAFGVKHGSTVLGSVSFDEVAFAGPAGATPFYLVQDSNAPIGAPIVNDAETVFCGPGGGSSVAILAIAAHITEDYQAKFGGKFVSVPHAFSEGRDTAETASGVAMTALGKTGDATHGTDSFVSLW
jgi:hypothetical protein